MKERNKTMYKRYIEDQREKKKRGRRKKRRRKLCMMLLFRFIHGQLFRD
jgi:hypothetical protein